jgi:hypothetical protein
MYLCPLAILLIFAIGVIVLSFVLPRIRERREDAPPTFATAFDDPGFSAQDTLLEPASSVNASSLLPDGEFSVLEVKSSESVLSEGTSPAGDAVAQGTTVESDLSDDGGSLEERQEEAMPAVEDGTDSDS